MAPSSPAVLSAPGSQGSEASDDTDSNEYSTLLGVLTLPSEPAAPEAADPGNDGLYQCAPQFSFAAGTAPGTKGIGLLAMLELVKAHSLTLI